MKRLLSYLIMISLSSFMLSACHINKLSESKASTATKNESKSKVNDDCPDDNSNTLKPVIATIAKGCPVNLN